MKTWTLCTVLLVSTLLAGCAGPSVRDYAVTRPRFFLEAAPNTDGTVVVLPKSGVNVSVNSKPVLTEGDIVNVELAQVDLGKCLLFELSPSARRDFYRLSGTHQGRRLVLTVNDYPLGARRIDGAIENGVVFIFVEMDDDALPQLVTNLKKSTVALQQELRRKG